MYDHERVNNLIRIFGVDTTKVSDGCHTFQELYDHRCMLYITLLNFLPEKYYIWKSRKHDDGSTWDGWFILGIGKEKGQQITYHLPEKYWNLCDFVVELNKAPVFDGHKSEDVLERLKDLLND